MAAALASPSPSDKAQLGPSVNEVTQQCSTNPSTLNPSQFAPSNWLLSSWWFLVRSSSAALFWSRLSAWVQLGRVRQLRCLVSTRVPRSATQRSSRLSSLTAAPNLNTSCNIVAHVIFSHIKISTGHVAQWLEPRPALCNASDPILSPVAQNAGSSPVMAKHFVIWFLLEVLQMSAGVTQFFNLRTFC